MPSAKYHPSWLDALLRANDGPTWIAAIEDVDPAAAQGLLKRKGLAGGAAHAGPVAQIKSEYAAGRLTIQDFIEWREQVVSVLLAVADIDDFRQKLPLLNSYRREAQRLHPLPGGQLGTMTDALREALWRGDLPLQHWVGFVDKRKNEIDRHLFLFTLPTGDNILDRWRDEATRQPLRYVWRPPEAELVEVGEEADGRLLLRWVGWRVSGDPPPWPGPNVLKDKRCVTFARVDLDSGAVELQIQRVRRGGTDALIAERELYANAIVAFFGVRPEPVHPEPAMRRLFSNARLTPGRWRIRLPNGGEILSVGVPGLIQKIRLAFERFYALELRGTWTVAEEQINVRIDARTEAIGVFSQCSPTLTRELLEIVRRRAEAERPTVKTQGPQPQPDAGSSSGNAPRFGKLRDIVGKVVAYERRLGHADVPVERLASREAVGDLLFSITDLLEALDKVGVRYLGATLYVICPITRTAAWWNGRMVEFSDGKIPETIDCDNEGRKHTHDTKGNLWLRTGHDQSKEKGLRYWIWIPILVYLALVTVLFIVLRHAFPDLAGFITAGYVIVVMPAIAATIWIYGPDNVKKAFAFGNRTTGAKKPTGTAPAANDDDDDDDD